MTKSADAEPGRSRRSVLAAAAAGAAGMATAGLARPGAAQASGGAQGTALILGNANTASASTIVTTTSTSAGTGAIDGVTTDIGIGVRGFSAAGTGMMAIGYRWGIYAFSDTGTPMLVRLGADVAQNVKPDTAVIISVEHPTTQVGLEAHGRIKLPERSGRAKVLAGKASVVVTVAGVTSGNYAIATLATNRASRYVRAVVCGPGKINIYLNASVSSATYVNWLVLG
ncbi:MAG: hypothetical protein WCK58_18230 [Chloroflexota bacterium]